MALTLKQLLLSRSANFRLVADLCAMRRIVQFLRHDFVLTATAADFEIVNGICAGAPGIIVFGAALRFSVFPAVAGRGGPVGWSILKF